MSNDLPFPGEKLNLGSVVVPRSILYKSATRSTRMKRPALASGTVQLRPIRTSSERSTPNVMSGAQLDLAPDGLAALQFIRRRQLDDVLDPARLLRVDLQVPGR